MKSTWTRVNFTWLTLASPRQSELQDQHWTISRKFMWYKQCELLTRLAHVFPAQHVFFIPMKECYTTSGSPLKRWKIWWIGSSEAKLSGIRPTLCHPEEVDPAWSNKINTNNWHFIQLPNIKQARLSITKKWIVIKGTTIISVLCFIYRF